MLDALPPSLSTSPRRTSSIAARSPASRGSSAPPQRCRRCSHRLALGGGSCGGDAVGCTAAVDSFPSARPDALLLLPCAPSSVGSSDVLCRRVRRTRRLAMQGGGLVVDAGPSRRRQRCCRLHRRQHFVPATPAWSLVAPPLRASLRLDPPLKTLLPCVGGRPAVARRRRVRRRVGADARRPPTPSPAESQLSARGGPRRAGRIVSLVRWVEGGLGT